MKDRQDIFDAWAQRVINKGEDKQILELIETFLHPNRFGSESAGYCKCPTNDTEAVYFAGRASVFFDLKTFFAKIRDINHG